MIVDLLQNLKSEGTYVLNLSFESLAQEASSDKISPAP